MEDDEKINEKELRPYDNVMNFLEFQIYGDFRILRKNTWMHIIRQATN